MMKKQVLELRDYQFPAFDFAMANDLSVLAVAPNGGKTEISIYIVEKYLALNPDARVLILAHSTLVLKENFVNRLDGKSVTFTYSDTFAPDAQVHVTLPQNNRKIIGHYDLLIVDEAHENYLAPTVQKIVAKVTPTKQLLLTGTPSRFIKQGGYNIYTLATNSIPSEYFAKLNIELVASNYDWMKALNKDLEVKLDFKFNKRATEKTLEAIVLKLIERVKLKVKPEHFNGTSILNKPVKWLNTFNTLGKTLFVCRSIKQAQDVNDILVAHGVDSRVSDSISDVDSSEVKNFLENKFNVLVVIDRARLGYSDDDLYNLIDMSGTHNPDIINQMFSRVLRIKQGDADCKKYYLKVTPQGDGMLDFTHACVCGALMLTDNKYLSTFNGSNFNGMLIPILKAKNTSRGSSSGCGTGSGKKQPKRLILPEFTHDVIDMFRNIICDLDKPVTVYKTTTIGEVRNILMGREEITFEMVLESTLIG